MTELSKYYVSVTGSIYLTIVPLNPLTKPRVFKVIGFYDTGLLKHKEIR